MATSVNLPVKTVSIKNGEAVIMVNDTPAACPYITRVLTPGKIQGTVNVQGTACGSHCALFDIAGNGDRFMIHTCYDDMDLKKYQEKPKENASIKSLIDTGFKEH